MIIYKKRVGNAFRLILGLMGFGVFFFAGFGGLISDHPLGDKAFFLFFLIMSIVGFWLCWKGMQKWFSPNPEFELTEKEFIIYDDPDYHRIGFHHMMDCSVYQGLRRWHLRVLGISLTPDAPYKGNSHRFQRWALNVAPEKSKIIF